MMGFSYEKRALKRPKLGPPDVYPQQPRQKEDELTPSNVTKGFTSAPQLPNNDEFGSAQGSNISASKIGAYLNAIVLKKEEINTLPDTGRKRQQINTKENFWPVTARNKNAVDMWFKDLAASKPLSSLSKKAPNFNKKEEMFVLLCEYQVPVLRATWFIKLSSAYTVAVSEQKIKKRQLPDPTQEWTNTLLKFMKEQFVKLHDYYQNSNYGSIAVVPVGGGPSPADEQRLAMKQWQYCILLAKHMYQEGLLERQEVLQWILDLLERLKLPNVEDGLLRILLSMTLQYLHEFVQSEQLSRRLVHLCTKKISILINHAMNQQVESSANQSLTQPATPQTPSPCPVTSHVSVCNQQNTSNIYGRTENSSSTTDPATILNEYLNCPHHRDIVISLSTVIQGVTLECPTALVWNSVGENKSFSLLNGSPLDYLPCSPSSLPMPQRCATQQIRTQLKLGEELIRQRSSAAAIRWFSDKWQQSSAGIKMQKVLNTLDALDKHNFEVIDRDNSMDTLYNNIFPPIPEQLTTMNYSSVLVRNNSKPNAVGIHNQSEDIKKEYDVWQDEVIVHILCEWAISNLRTGEHRAIAVARLLEKRQAEILNPTSFSTPPHENDTSDDKDSVTSVAVPFPIFQSVLMKYLDMHAPVSDNNPENNTRFTNLVHLFSQLIRHDMFSHDTYMCTLISRGDLNVSGTTNTNCDTNANLNTNTKLIDNNTNAGSRSSYMQLENDAGLPNTNDCDDSKIDDDLDKLLQHIKQEQQNSMDGPDSPKIEPTVSGHESRENDQHLKSSRHVVYATHFPLPLDDECSTHESNQRYVLLFGVGKQREDARHTVKRISKDICKLFSKKFCIDVAEGGKVKKHSKGEFNFELITNRFQSLSYFDEHYVAYQCSSNLIETINNFAVGNSNYLPVQEHVAFLFDLMELSLNVDGLIDLCITLLVEIPEVEVQLANRGSSLVKLYCSQLLLYIIGVLRRYHTCLLMSQEQTVAVFEGLFRIVRNVPNPGECSSVERCIFSHLYALYTSNSQLKLLPIGLDLGRIRQTILREAGSTTNSGTRNPVFMSEAIMTYRRGSRIDPMWIRQLNESATNRYSLVCNVIITLCNDTNNNDVDRLNDLGIFCAELTAACNALPEEWIGVLMALCCSSNPSSFGDVLSRVDVQDTKIHNSLAIFTAILVARNCIRLDQFLKLAALPSLVLVCNDGRREANADAEAGARLTCHLLLRLFKTNESPQPALYSVGTSPHPMVNHNAGVWCIKQSCDRHLLAAMHHNLQLEAFIAVLKAIIVVGDATGVRPGILLKKSPSGHQTPNQLPLCQILGTSDHMSDNLSFDLGGSNSMEINSPTLSEFAQGVLREICNQEWVLDRCLLNPDKLCESLIDPLLAPKQTQRLLHMICYPEINATSTDSCLDHKTVIDNIIQKLDQWTLRLSYLNMRLMFNQLEKKAELNQWLDMVAKAAISVFQLNKGEPKTKPESIWLIAPLISKLPNAVQGRVLKVAGQVLENIQAAGSSESVSISSSMSNGCTSGRNSKGTPQHNQHMLQQQRSPAMSTAALMHYQPFLSLILTCLKEQEDQREPLLTSLHSQLSQFLTMNNDERLNGAATDFSCKGEDGLLLRFSLIGGMFDTIQLNTSLTTDWAVLLVQLITHGIIDNSNNSDLFSTVIDMLATLIHSTLVADSQNEKGEENRKHYQNLMKKLKKEVGDKKSLSVAQVRQLLPLPKVQCEVIACEPIGCITDMKGNKITGFDSLDKKHGLHVVEKQRVSAWDFLEGHKNPAPLSWAWFGAVRIERKPLWYEENHRLLKYHTHSLVKPSSYFLEPLPLPPEDMEPPMEKPMKVGAPGAPDTPTSVEQSPRGMKRALPKGPNNQRRKKQPAKPITPTGPIPPVMHPQVQGAQIPSQSMNYPPGGPPQGPPGQANAGMYACSPGPGSGPQWGGYPPQTAGHMNQQPAPPYYSHQMGPVGARFERPSQHQGKVALSNMLRSRAPNNQYVGMQQQQQSMPPHNYQTMQRHQYNIRQQIRASHNIPANQPAGPNTMFAGGTPGPPNSGQQQMFANMPMAINQNYNGFVGPPQQMQQQQQPQQPQQQQQQMPMSNSQQSMYQQQQIQSQQAAAGGGSSFGMRQQEFQQQQQQQQQQQRRPHFMQQAPNVTMNSMNNQQPAPPYSRPVTPQTQVNVQQQQQQQQQYQAQRMRQILALQQQQQHQQHHQQQQQPHHLAQIQRQLQNSTQPQNPYMQPPAY